MIKAAIFDMDGLLIDSEPLWVETYTSVFKTVGIKWDKERHSKYTGQRQAEVIEHVFHEEPWKDKTQEEVLDDIFEDIVNRIKSDGELKPGVHQTFKVCKQAGLPMAIASSSPHVVINAVVDSLELRDYFDHIQSAQHEPYGKPHPAVFIAAADQLDVAPMHCLVFEDAPAGVLAAKAAKMKCVAVPEPEFKNDPFIKTADVVIDSLEDFDEKTLDGLNKD